MSDSQKTSPEQEAAEQTPAGTMPVSFSQFIVSLGSSALVHLGELADPSSGQRTPDLRLARHSIDVIALLKEKTKGNLDEDELKLMDALLFDLRQKYTAAANKA